MECGCNAGFKEEVQHQPSDRNHRNEEGSHQRQTRGVRESQKESQRSRKLKTGRDGERTSGQSRGTKGRTKTRNGHRRYKGTDQTKENRQPDVCEFSQRLSPGRSHDRHCKMDSDWRRRGQGSSNIGYNSRRTNWIHSRTGPRLQQQTRGGSSGTLRNVRCASKHKH